MCTAASLPEEQLLLLHVEEQAMVQVVIKEVAAHLDMKDSSKINTVCTYTVPLTLTLTLH